MGSSAISWLPEMGQDDNPNFTFDEDLGAILGNDFEAFLSPEESLSPSSALINVSSSNSMINSFPEPPQKMHKPTTCNPIATSSPVILNFSNRNSPEHTITTSLNVHSKHGQNTKKPARLLRPPSQTYDHAKAERKRRRHLSQRFLTLSSIVPGLKKTDKTSVLEDAIKYLKFLQERVKNLEERAPNKTMESVVLVKKSQVAMEDDDKTPNDEPLPEIEAKICNNQILIRINCEKQKGILSNLISTLEKLHFSIVNVSTSTFGSLVLFITITLEMEKEFNLTMQEVVRKLRTAF